MFDHAHLLANWRSQPPAAPETLHIHEFDCRDFPSGSEQQLELGYGSREDFLSPLHFWMSAYCATSIYLQPISPTELPDAEGIGIESAVCERISREEFARVVAEYSGSLRRDLPAYIRDLDGWKDGLCLHRDWNHVEIIAALDHQYLWFKWWTTA
ncbi:hypothetical protein [Lysobacter enzymogenes]|uniref:hypothetical protein n=1 Tax=Lysobacter enzymogenes TaxID=69 RepID=UPI001A969564|nr:hypothetical protein [Lysobacter enzymogenes]QQP94128.1 hypothetical protein JHW38_12650 [Lysobacter enzymogenes]